MTELNSPASKAGQTRRQAAGDSAVGGWFSDERAEDRVTEFGEQAPIVWVLPNDGSGAPFCPSRNPPSPARAQTLVDFAGLNPPYMSRQLQAGGARTMHSDLGEKIGEGAVADVHAWAPGQVVKLFRAGVPTRFGVHEARVTRAVFAAGGPAPEVLGEVTVAGRFGIVLPRFDGASLLELSRSGAVTREHAGAMLAALARAVHATPAPTEVPSLRTQLEGLLRVAGDTIPERIAAGVLPMLARLPREDGLCHGDLHTGNVIVTADGPRLIDWTGALRAPVTLELATCHIIHTEAAPELVSDPDRPRAVNSALQAAYARLSGVSHEALEAAIAPHLPVARVLALLIGAWPPALRPQLIARIEKNLEP